jgi:hypothetical protein
MVRKGIATSVPESAFGQKAFLGRGFFPTEMSAGLAL